VRQWRALIRYRHHLVRRRTLIRNWIRALFEQAGVALPKGKLCWTAAGVETLREESRDLDRLSTIELCQTLN
jgi:transposase